MDGASAIGPLRPIRRVGFSDNCPRFARRSRFAHGLTYLAGERRHDREGPLDRNRSALCIALRPRVHLLVELVATTTIRLAHLDGALGFSWARDTGQRSGSSPVFLRGRDCRPELRKETPRALRRSTFRGPTHYDRHLRGVGDSVLAGDEGRHRRPDLGGAIDRPFYRRRFQTSELAPEHSARARLLFAVDAFASTRSESEMGNRFRAQFGAGP